MQANIDSTVDMEEFRFLLTGGISAGEVPPNPLPWLGDKLWAEMNRLSSFLGFVGFAEELHKNPVSPLQSIDLMIWFCNHAASNTYCCIGWIPDTQALACCVLALILTHSFPYFPGKNIAYLIL